MKTKEQISIAPDRSILDALRQMDSESCKLLMVMDGEHFIGLLSIGDVQRSVLKEVPLEQPVSEIMRVDNTLATTADSKDAVRELMFTKRTEFMPVLDAEGKLAEVIFWEDVFGQEKIQHNKVNLPVVIMAGGKGTRLKPFSYILPKPLFPLGEQTILEEIMDRFQAVGCERFHLSVNYKADFIKNYLSQVEKEYNLNYFQEDKPLGTAGSLHLLRDQIQETFFVSNCDIVIDCDYTEFVKYHREHKNEVTLIGALKHIKIPYGTLLTGEDGKLLELKEKPELSYLINTGLYILEPHLLDEVPEDELYHITDLIEKVKKRGGNVGVFPVSEKSWCDIGQWEEYRRTMNILGESS